MAAAGRPEVVLVNRCIIEAGDEFLLLQRSEGDNYLPGWWEFPGGKLEAGQDLNTALDSEVLQETGLIVDVSSPLKFVDSHLVDSGKYEGMLYVVHFSLGEFAGGEVELSDEHSDYAWDSYEGALGRDLTPECEKALRFLGATMLAKPEPKYSLV